MATVLFNFCTGNISFLFFVHSFFISIVRFKICTNHDISQNYLLTIYSKQPSKSLLFFMPIEVFVWMKTTDSQTLHFIYNKNVIWTPLYVHTLKTNGTVSHLVSFPQQKKVKISITVKSPPPPLNISRFFFPSKNPNPKKKKRQSPP